MGDVEDPAPRHRTMHALGQKVPWMPQMGTNVSFAPVFQTQTYRLNRGRVNVDEDGGDEEDSQPVSVEFSGFDVRRGTDEFWASGRKRRLLFGPTQETDASRLERHFVADGAMGHKPGVPRNFKESDPSLVFRGLTLIAPKVTDMIQVSPRGVPVGMRLTNVVRGTREHDAAVRAAAVSASFILVNKAAFRLDTDPEEFDVLEPTVVTEGGVRRPVLHFGDRLVNGAGFSRRLLDEAKPGIPILLELLRSIVEQPAEYPLNVFFEKDHGQKCDHACYRCLMRYGNQPYHGLLDWRLGLSFLEALLIPDYKCGLDGVFGDKAPPSLRGWPELARHCGAEMKRRFGGDLVSLGEATAPIWAFQLGKGTPWAIIGHPLWNPDKPTGIARAAYDELDGMLADSDDVPPITFANTFDIVRRPVAVYANLKKGSRR